MSDRIIKDINIKCDKCGKDIRFKVYYNKDKESNVYCKFNLDDVDVCSCLDVGKCRTLFAKIISIIVVYYSTKWESSSC